MLYDSDTSVVRAWLVDALAAGAPQGKTRAGLAGHCGVRRQAVSAWLKTGRITKTNLTKASQYFGHSPRFGATPTAPSAREPDPSAYAPAVTLPRWPFRRVTLARLLALGPQTVANIDAALEGIVSAAEASAAAPRKTRRRA